MKEKYSVFEVAEYVTGWLISNTSWHDVNAISAALHNSLQMLEDDQDGIEAHFKRRAFYRNEN